MEPDIDTGSAHSARIYDSIIGGEDHYPADREAGIVRRILDPLPSGSFLAMSIDTAEFAPDEVDRVAREYAARGMPTRLRTFAEAEESFTGLELVQPDIVQVHTWHPDGTGTEVIRDEDIAMYGVVGRKPWGGP